MAGAASSEKDTVMLVSPLAQTDPTPAQRAYLSRRKSSPRSDRIAHASFQREVLKESAIDDGDRKAEARQLVRQKAAIALRAVRTEARAHRLDIAV